MLILFKYSKGREDCKKTYMRWIENSIIFVTKFMRNSLQIVSTQASLNEI